MGKKVKIDPYNLEFKEENKFQKLIKIILADFVAIFIIVILSYIIFSYTIESKEEKMLKTQNAQLRQQYEFLEKQYLENEKNLKHLEQQDSNLYKLLFASSPRYEKDIAPIDLTQLKGRKAIKQAKKNKKELQTLLTSVKTQNQKVKNFFDSLNLENLSNLPSILPVPRIKEEKYTIYGFGRKLDLKYGISKIHKGIDISTLYNVPVLATMNGTVIKTVRNDKTTGNSIYIQNGDYTIVYHYLADIKVSQGQKVKQYDVIAYTGISGRSILPHVHYEVHYKEKPINPIFYLFLSYSPEEFFEMYKKTMLIGICLD